MLVCRSVFRCYNKLFPLFFMKILFSLFNMASTFNMMADWKKKRNLINFNRIEFQFSNSAIKRQNVATIVYIRQFVMTKREKNVFFSFQICKKKKKRFSQRKKKTVHLMMPDFRQSISFLSSLFNNSIVQMTSTQFVEKKSSVVILSIFNFQRSKRNDIMTESSTVFTSQSLIKSKILREECF